MDLVNKINSAQRREVIDEDKRIHKRALDSEFAFVKRIGEDSLPPVGVEKYNIIKLNNLIQSLRGELEATSIEIENILNKSIEERGVDDEGNSIGLAGETLSSSTSKEALKYIDTGKAIIYWNNLVSLKKSFNMTEKQVQELWDYLHQNIDPVLDELIYKIEEIEIFHPDTYELYDIKAVRKLQEFINNEQFNTIPAITKYSKEQIKALRDTRALEQFRDEEQIAHELGYVGEQPPEEGEEVNFNPWEGMGKKRRKPKKKMDSDEFEINMEIHNKNMDKKQLNQMKKAIKKMPLPFDDGDDSNYLK